VLRQHWERLSAAELGEQLGRKPESVRQRLTRMGLTRRRTTEHIPWSDRDDRTLSTLYGTMSYDEIAARLGRTVSSVASRAGRLGLPGGDEH
jgi:DNA-directed RNA polymerase specialized sigma24 family protein